MLNNCRTQETSFDDPSFTCDHACDAGSVVQDSAQLPGRLSVYSIETRIDLQLCHVCLADEDDHVNAKIQGRQGAVPDSRQKETDD